MKGWKKTLLACACLLCVIVALIVFLPARWVAPWLQARLHGAQLRAVGGLVWQGHAGQVITADGTELGRLQWRLSRRALLGRIRLVLRIDGPAVQAAGALERTGEVAYWHDARLDLALDSLPHPPATPWGTPGGALAVRLQHARLQAGWPMTLAATARWRQATVRTGGEVIALGTIEADASGDNGVIEVDLHDDGRGPLDVRGTMQVSPLGWRLDADLQLRGGQPALRRWLARFGTPDAQGHVHIQRGAGLGAATFSGAPR